MTLAFGQSGRGQSNVPPQASAVPAPSFDVAAIHLHQPVPHEHSHIVNTNGGFIAVNVDLKAILEWAFDVPSSRIVGGPEWINSARFDIEAKADNALDTIPQNDASAAKLEKRRMVQALLADRFRLTFHNETRELPIYALVIANGGPKFLDSKANGTTVNAGSGRLQLEGGENTVALLATWLAQPLGRVVVDETGVQGRYNIVLKWTPEYAVPPTANLASASDPSEPSIFTAIQEQLGLKLESRKAPVQVFFIDHIEMPSEN